MILANEIQQPQYVGMTDTDLAAALNAQTPVRRRVPIAELQARAMESGVYMALRVAVGTPGTPEQLRAVCQTVLDLANARFSDVDLDNPSAVQMFGALRQAGIITVEQVAMIDALAIAGYTSRAQVLGLGAVTVDDIERRKRDRRQHHGDCDLHDGDDLAGDWPGRNNAGGRGGCGVMGFGPARVGPKFTR